MTTMSEQPGDKLPAREMRSHQIVKYPRFNELYETMEECHLMSTMSGEPKCLLLQGGTGVGKTTLIDHYAQTYTQRHAVDDLSVPVLCIYVPSPVTVKALIADMLNALGIVESRGKPLYELRLRLVHYLVSSGVEMVILDEFQHLIEHSGRNQAEVADFLKNLIKESGIPFVLVGLDQGSAKNSKWNIFLKEHLQVSRLFARREKLVRFSTKTTKEFSVFLHLACESLGAEVVGMTEAVFRRRTLDCTNGVVSNVMDLLHYALIEARKEGAEQIAASHLSVAFLKHVQPITGVKKDPFA